MTGNLVHCHRCKEEITRNQITESYRGYYYHDDCFKNLLADAELAQAQVKPHDPVNHPSHYTSDPSGVECITITRHRNFNIGNAIKYLWRAGLKDSAPVIEDIDKAIWYLKDEKKRLLKEANRGR